jgi:uncharacterized protein GlcG (DUF336 family)
MTKNKYLLSAVSLAVMLGAETAVAGGLGCADVPSHSELKAALQAVQELDNGGFGLDMWATVVNRDGEVCAVAFSGANRWAQWPGSRVISAQKANTANAFSLDGLALSTANLHEAVQPGGSLYGLQHSNPVDTAVAYGKSGDNNSAKHKKNFDASEYGTASDPMVGLMPGGVNVFGGGLALYTENPGAVGALGVSGDTSCADHNIAWRVRDTLGLDFVPGGVCTQDGDPPGATQECGTSDTDTSDNMTFTAGTGFDHPMCGDVDSAAAGDEGDDEMENALVAAQCPIGDGATDGCLDGIEAP